MRIAINALSARQGGGVIYLNRLVYHLSQIDQRNDYYIFTTSENRKQIIGFCHACFHVIELPIRNLAHRVLYEQVIMPVMVGRLGIDILYAPAEVAPLLAPCKVVLGIQNIKVYCQVGPTYPFGDRLRLRALRSLAWLSSRKARRVICVSEHLRQHVVQVLNLNASRTHVIPHGVDAKLFEKNGEPSGFEKDWAPLIRETIKEGSYILSVSNLARHKNYETLIYAYAILDPALRQKHKLLIVGENTGAYYDELSALARQLGIRANIVFAGRLDHKHMPYIYKRAAVLVFPSRLESFGLPILEAMASSVPVVAANAAALPEVGGDACLYFDPDNPAELADLMRRVLTDTCLRSHLIHREKNRVQHFSWIKTARETLAIFKKVCMPG